MPLDRRHFVKKIGGLAGTFALSSLFSPTQITALENAFQNIRELSPDEVAKEEPFWRQIKLAYTPSSSLLDLNNGGVSPQPKVVQEAFVHYNRLSNEAPSYYMWRQLDKGRRVIRERLAEMAGVEKETIAITRNTTESLEIVIFGLRLKAGDEVILSRQGYPNMINAWKQRAFREGIVLRWLDFEMPQENTAYFVDKYKAAINARTKVMSITQVINWNGQVLPVKEIIELAKDKNIETLVDGAHAFAQLDFTISDLNCDYFGTSLHKWLCAPFGTGMLYVKKDKIKNLYPLFAIEDPESTKIQKFENSGTRSAAIEQAIIPAIEFHQMIGTARKQERLRYLKNYWITQTHDIPGIQYHCPQKTGFDCGIGLFSIEGLEDNKIVGALINTYLIHTISIDQDGIKGIRISPNVFTLTSDLDRFIRALREIVKS